jgi:uroporphyrinogen-III synthase
VSQPGTSVNPGAAARGGTPWAITRARDEAERVVTELRAQELSAFPLPCIERVALPVEPFTVAGHRVVLFTSVGAVEAAVGALAASQPIEVAALAPVTSAALGRQHIIPTIEASGGVVALAQAVCESLQQRRISQPRFWYPTSDVGLAGADQSEAVRLLEGLGPVTRTVAYQTRAPESLPADLLALPPVYGVFFASPSAVTNFYAAGPRLTPRRVVCWGASTLREASRYDATAVVAPRDRPLADTLKALENPHG